MRSAPQTRARRRSSVVERILGKAEVPSSILGGGTSFPAIAMSTPRDKNPENPASGAGKTATGRSAAQRKRLAEALRANLKRRKAAGQGTDSRAGSSRTGPDGTPETGHEE